MKGEVIDKILEDEIKLIIIMKEIQKEKNLSIMPHLWKTNDPEKDCWYRGKPKCRNCKKFEHTEKNCKFKKIHQVNFSEKKKKNKIEEELIYACEAAMEEKNDTWYVNSACSDHMTRNDNIFRNLDT